MSKVYLVIVESLDKIKKLKSILGADYEIIASMGHVNELFGSPEQKRPLHRV